MDEVIAPLTYFLFGSKTKPLFDFSTLLSNVKCVFTKLSPILFSKFKFTKFLKRQSLNWKRSYLVFKLVRYYAGYSIFNIGLKYQSLFVFNRPIQPRKAESWGWFNNAII